MANARESLAAWLRDAHAMEGQEISLLETQIRARDREDLRKYHEMGARYGGLGLAATTADDPQVLAAVGSRVAGQAIVSELRC